MKQWILEKVPTKLAEPNADIEFWEYIIEWYEKNPYPGNNSTAEPYTYAGALDGYVVNWEETQKNNPTP